jgi:hypothetical protein
MAGADVLGSKGWLVQWACLMMMLGALCLGAPRQAGPDEPAHAIRAAALVRGELTGEASTAGDAYRSFRVPAWVTQPDPGCFAFVPQQRAGCASVDGSTESVELASSAASYPPFAYLLPGLGTLAGDSARSLWLSRLLGAAFCAAVVAASLHRLRRLGARSSVAATLLALTPAAVFSMTVINPSGPTIAGSVAVVAALLCLDQGDRRADRLLAVGATAMALSRSDGWFWLAVVIGLTAVLLGTAPRALWSSVSVGARAIVLGVAAVGAAWAVLVRPEFVPVPTDLTGRQLVSEVVSRTAGHIEEAIGLFGWADTRIPLIASYLWWGTLGALAMVAYLSRRTRSLVVFGASLLGFVFAGWLGDLIPASSVGLIWQGRYAIPILVVGVIALGAGDPSWARATTSRDWPAVVGLCAVVVWNFSFYQALRRWSVGTQGTLWPFNWERGGSAVDPLLCLALFTLGSGLLWSLNFTPLPSVLGTRTARASMPTGGVPASPVDPRVVPEVAPAGEVTASPSS